MDSKNAAESYQRASVESAPPLQVVRMLYQGALRFLSQALQVDPTTDPDLFLEHLSNADAIVSELRGSLDHDVGADVAERLESLYEFCEGQLASATLSHDRAAVEPVVRVLKTLLEGWMQIDLEGSKPPAAPSGDAG